MLINGSAKQGASELVEMRLSPFEGNRPPRQAADTTRFFTVSQTGIVTWVVNQYPYVGPEITIIYGNVSDGRKSEYDAPYAIELDCRYCNECRERLDGYVHCALLAARLHASLSIRANTCLDGLSNVSSWL